MANRNGYRGYMATRAVRGVVTPQRVQNLVIRDYSARQGLTYLMSVSEFAMPGCFMILENALLELDRTLGIIAFSAFMLPETAQARAQIYRRIFDAGATFHAALENLSLKTPSDVRPFEDTITAALLLERVPLRGRYEKTEGALCERSDSFVTALLASPNGGSAVTRIT